MSSPASPDQSASPAAWERLGETSRENFRIFELRRSRFRHRRDAREGEFVVIDAPDWVNVLAVTDDDRLVLVRQYRFGREYFTTEIPGGMMECGEDPVSAGVRELREETGYAGSSARLLASIDPNPAIQSNRCHVVLVEGAKRVGDTQFDEHEELELSLDSVDAIIARAVRGEITHSLVVCALFFLRELRAGRIPPAV